MDALKLVLIVLVTFCSGFYFGCNRTQDSGMEQLSELALKGKQVFENKKCFSCHNLSEKKSETSAPDLSDPIFANDSMFVQAHLKFVDQSYMLNIKLTDQEIQAVSHYVAEIHRSKQKAVPEDKADKHCPVCSAAVSSEKASEENLFVDYLGTKYYFECKDCLNTFLKAPEIYSKIYEQNHENDSNSTSKL